MKPTGIIDVGSNSIRFVVFGGAERVPSALFNEKVSPALGRGVHLDGRLEAQAMDRALAALARFARLAQDMKLERIHVVATAAVREAANGAEFLDAVRKLGLEPAVLSGEEEAELAALGVLSAIPDSDGIVADLGGGSLELVRVKDGTIGERVSLPLGVFRLNGRSAAELADTIRDSIGGWDTGAVQRLYLVGGSFRGVARLDLADLRHALPIVHGHRIEADRVPVLAALLAGMGDKELRAMTRLSGSRIETLPAAMVVMDALFRLLEPEQAITSAHGLREGLLFRDLDAETRRKDPLIEAAMEIGETLGRFGDHGTSIDRWIEPLFPDDAPADQRVRLAACQMSDVAWNAHPDYRSERAVDMALHGNWLGVDVRDRTLLGQALCHVFDGDYELPHAVAALLDARELARAAAWGRAVRLAQRLSGGTEPGLGRAKVALTEDAVCLSVEGGSDIAGEIVAKRLAQLAKALGREARIEPA